MAGKLILLVKKNYKLVIRTRSSALIVILGPLLLIMLVGLAFNTASVYSIRIATYSEQYSSLTESIIEQLRNRQFSVIKAETKDACVSGLRNNVFNVCAVFPPDLDANKKSSIVFYVDNTKLNLVYAVLDALKSTVQTTNKELTEQMVQSIYDVVTSAQGELGDKESIVTSFQETNSQLDKNVNDAVNSLSKMQIAFDQNELPVHAIESLLEAQSNASDVSQVMSRLKSRLNDLKNEVDTANAAKANTLSALDALRPSLLVNQRYAASLLAAFQNIQKGIDSAKQAGVSDISSPLSTKIEPITPEKSSLSYIFPTLLALIIMFVSMLLASTLEIRERSAKIYFKNFITPTRTSTFLAANFLTNFSIVLLQMVILLAAASIFFKAQMLPIMAALFLILLAVAALFILLGMLLGNIFRSEETSAIAAISISFIFLFFSGTILPIETFPESFRGVTSLNPFYVSQTLLNQIMLFNAPLATLMHSLLTLIGTIALLIAAVFISRQIFQKSI